MYFARALLLVFYGDEYCEAFNEFRNQPDAQIFFWYNSLAASPNDAYCTMMKSANGCGLL